MKLYQEILLKILEDQESKISFCDLPENISLITEQACYKTLEQIKEVIDDESLEDDECFHKIEKIICLFEDLGSPSSRHDFG